MSFMPFLASDDMELLGSPSSRPGAPHRRIRSDPTDILQALRAERNSTWGGSADYVPATKRDLSPMGSSSSYPAFKKHAAGHSSMKTEDHGMPYHSMFVDAGLATVLLTATPCDSDVGFDAGSETNDAPSGKGSKKDVPMWTVEEDLLILQLVERHGKRWSKIAAHLPERTDNGVRNRWNRMERAQVLRQSRGPDAGYRCRRCGQPKRGHICAALTLGDTPAGEELQQKAEALSKLSANRMRPPSAATSETASVSESRSEQSTPTLAPQRTPSPQIQPLHTNACVVKSELQPLDASTCEVKSELVSPAAIPSHSWTAPASSVTGLSVFEEVQLDDFLDELQLHEFVKQPSQLFGSALGSGAFYEASQAALLSQASLNSLLLTLTENSARPRDHVSPLLVF